MANRTANACQSDDETNCKNNDELSSQISEIIHKVVKTSQRSRPECACNSIHEATKDTKLKTKAINTMSKSDKGGLGEIKSKKKQKNKSKDFVNELQTEDRSVQTELFQVSVHFLHDRNYAIHVKLPLNPTFLFLIRWLCKL